MNLKKQILRLGAAALALLLILCGCKAGEEENGEEIITDLGYEMLDLPTLVDRIYAAIEISDLTFLSVETVDDYQTLTEQFYLDLDQVLDYEVRSAEGKYGVADVAVIRIRNKDAAEDIIAALENRRDDRINEFSKYDVYDSYEIALNATIYQTDELVVMLMLDEDSKAAAMEIIDSFLP